MPNEPPGSTETDPPLCPDPAGSGGYTDCPPGVKPPKTKPGQWAAPPPWQKKDAGKGGPVGTSQDVISIARAQIGQYSHTNKFNTWYGLPGTEWCDEFVSWVFNQANALPAIGGKFALTTAHAKWFESKGRWSRTPQVGTLVFFDWGGNTSSIAAIDHVGICVGVNADGTVKTIEGNTGNDQVAERNRAMSNIVGFGAPDMTGVGQSGGLGAQPAGFGDPLGILSKLESVVKHIISPMFWKAAGLFTMGVLAIILGVVFVNRRKIGEVAMEGAQLYATKGLSKAGAA